MAAAALRLFERLKDLGINITQVRAHTTSEKMLFDEQFLDFLEKLTISQWRLLANTAEEPSALNAQINIYNQLVGNRLRKCTQEKEVIQQTLGTRWRFVVLPTFPRPDKTKTTITMTIEGVSERVFQLGCQSNRLLNCVGRDNLRNIFLYDEEPYWSIFREIQRAGSIDVFQKACPLFTGNSSNFTTSWMWLCARQQTSHTESSRVISSPFWRDTLQRLTWLAQRETVEKRTWPLLQFGLTNSKEKTSSVRQLPNRKESKCVLPDLPFVYKESRVECCSHKKTMLRRDLLVCPRKGLRYHGVSLLQKHSTVYDICARYYNFAEDPPASFNAVSRNVRTKLVGTVQMLFKLHGHQSGRAVQLQLLARPGTSFRRTGRCLESVARSNRTGRLKCGWKKGKYQIELNV